MRVHKISKVIIGLFITLGLLMCVLCIMAFIEQPYFYLILLLIIPLVFIFYGVYLLKKRIDCKGFYWDDEGIVIDLRGNKVYWHEIEEIKLVAGRGGKSTVIYTYYSYHETIRIRRNKWMPTPAHLIDWYFIEKPKDYHMNLMDYWEERKKKKALS